MKKGLLSLLAVALTVVGCQNYDDQFQSLTDQITELATTVEGLTAVRQQVTDLQGTVTSLRGVADAIAANVTSIGTDVEGVAAGVASNTAGITGLGGDISTLGTNLNVELDAIDTQIALILTELDDVATADALTAVASQIIELQEDVTELLAANATINQSITINSLATLQYAESLISTEEGDPNVIVNGNVTVNITQAFATTTSVTIDRINAVTNKFATILGKEGADGLVEVTYTASPSIGELEMNSLVFVDTDLDISGTTATSIDALANVTGAASLTFTGDISFETPLNISGDLVIGTGATEFDFSDGSAASVSTAGSSAGVLVLNSASSVNTGDAVVTDITANEALTITVGQTGAYASLSIVAADANSIVVEAGSITGALSITGQDSQTTIDLAGVATIGGAVNIGDAATVDLTALTTINNNATIGGNNLTTPALATVTGTLIIEDEVTVALPAFSATSSTTTLTVAETASLRAASSTILGGDSLENLTLTHQPSTGAFNANATTYPALTVLHVTGVEDTDDPTAQANTIEVEGAIIEDVTIAGWFDSVTVTNTDELTDLEVGGELNSLTIHDNEELVNLTLNQDHIEGADAHDLTVTSNPELVNLTTANMEEVGDVHIRDNAKLATIDLSSADGTSPVSGSFTVSISNNSLLGAYTAATTETTTTLYVPTVIASDDLNSVKLFIDDAASAVTYNFDMIIDVVNYDANDGSAIVTSTLAAAFTADTDKTTGTGSIDTAAELALITTE